MLEHVHPAQRLAAMSQVNGAVLAAVLEDMPLGRIAHTIALAADSSVSTSQL